MLTSNSQLSFTSHPTTIKNSSTINKRLSISTPLTKSSSIKDSPNETPLNTYRSSNEKKKSPNLYINPSILLQIQSSLLDETSNIELLKDERKNIININESNNEKIIPKNTKSLSNIPKSIDKNVSASAIKQAVIGLRTSLKNDSTSYDKLVADAKSKNIKRPEPLPIKKIVTPRQMENKEPNIEIVEKLTEKLPQRKVVEKSTVKYDISAPKTIVAPKAPLTPPLASFVPSVSYRSQPPVKSLISMTLPSYKGSSPPSFAPLSISNPSNVPVVLMNQLINAKNAAKQEFEQGHRVIEAPSLVAPTVFSKTQGAKAEVIQKSQRAILEDLEYEINNLNKESFVLKSEKQTIASQNKLKANIQQLKKSESEYLSIIVPLVNDFVLSASNAEEITKHTYTCSSLDDLEINYSTALNWLSFIEKQPNLKTITSQFNADIKWLRSKIDGIENSVDQNFIDLKGKDIQSYVNEAVEKLKSQILDENVKLMQKEVSRQAKMDVKSLKEAKEMAELRAEELSLIVKEKEIREKNLIDELKRPNKIIQEAEKEIDSLSSALLPLLNEANAKIDKLRNKHFVNDPTLLSKIASLSGRQIAQNAVENLLEFLLEDTVDELNRLESIQAIESTMASEYDKLGHAISVLDDYQNSLDQVEAKIHGEQRITNDSAFPNYTFPTAMVKSPINNQNYISSPNFQSNKFPEYQHFEIKDSFKPIMSSSIPFKPYEFTHTNASHTNEPAYDQISKPNNSRNSKSLLKLTDVTLLMEDMIPAKNKYEEYIKLNNIEDLDDMTKLIADDLINDVLVSISSEFSNMCDSVVDSIVHNELKI